MVIQYMIHIPLADDHTSPPPPLPVTEYIHVIGLQPASDLPISPEIVSEIKISPDSEYMPIYINFLNIRLDYEQNMKLGRIQCIAVDNIIDENEVMVGSWQRKGEKI